VSHVSSAVKVGRNAWKRRSQARYFCNLVFQASKNCFPWECTFPSRKDSFIHGNARFWAAIFKIDLLVGMQRILLLLKFSNKLVNLNLVKIMAQLEIQGPIAKLKGAHRFLQGPRDLYCSHYLKMTL